MGPPLAFPILDFRFAISATPRRAAANRPCNRKSQIKNRKSHALHWLDDLLKVHPAIERRKGPDVGDIQPGCSSSPSPGNPSKLNSERCIPAASDAASDRSASTWEWQFKVQGFRFKVGGCQL